MKKLTVISGKGGTGKTTVTANLAALADNLILADCDVDAPNMHLLMKPKVIEAEVFKGAKVAVKDQLKCIECGLCKELCNFKAITSDFKVDEIRCEGCGLCVAKCPSDALKLELEETGDLYYSQTKFAPMVHAKLKIGAENSGKLVSQVKEKAESLAQQEEKELLLIDGSPGIGCPVIASINGVDSVLVVTEPTKSGLADLKRVLKTVKYFNLPAVVAINKYDLNQEISLEIESFCRQNQVKIVGKLPFSKVIVEAMQQGELVVESAPESKVTTAIKELWEKVSCDLKLKG
ncbi:(4Fe-4S)-binding protein [Orenia metallireducens]|jgi:MinD superfamily P-loop ATPase|uniref:(4Fe-4S)-binding protein n=1 Tax=Orenia metallireducens TaxID=1413210 RepID=A0A1C0A4V6_9FIRM|nr:ATP-binding protein [Orenia metallireducens]OCL25161.1 (4Fe-4S)-binding protein [Orenia metallireducens]